MSGVKSVPVGSGSIFVVDEGAGTEVIFLHAGVADSRMWSDQLRYLSESYRAIAYDRRGFGRTVSKNGVFSHVNDLAKVFESLGVDRAVLVGCSQGARVAIDFYLQHPHCVRKLFLCSAAVSGQPTPSIVDDHTSKLLADIDIAEERGDLSRVNELEARLWLDGPRSQVGRVSGAERELFLKMNSIALESPELTQEHHPPEAMSRLSEINSSSLIAYGALDLLGVRERSAEIARRIANSRTYEFRSSAHLPSLDSPEEFNNVLTSFLPE